MDSNDINIHLEFGDDSDEKKILECNIDMMMGEKAT